MRNINKIPPKTYLFLTLFSGFIALLIYRSTIFSCLYYSTLKESTTTLLSLWAGSLILLYFLTRKRRRNFFSIFTNTVFPFALYTFFSYEWTHYYVALTSMAAFMILTVIYWVMILVRTVYAGDMDEFLVICKRRLYYCIAGTKSIFAVCLSVLMIYVFTLNAFRLPSAIPAVKPTVDVVEDKKEFFEENMAAISVIDPSVWKDTDCSGRLNALQAIINNEKVQSGINHEVNLQSEYLGLGLNGTYNDKTHTVTINSMLVKDDDPSQAVKTICHEVRHAYQHSVANAYLSLDKDFQMLQIFDTVREYYENLDDYKDGQRDGFDQYRNQLVEKDCRDYSEVRLKYYFEQVSDYLVNNKEA